MAEKQTSELNVDVEIDRIVHEPARLKVLAYLSLVEGADFTFLVSRIGLTMGNLSAHISKLEETGYVLVAKDFVDNRPRTLLSITEQGKKAFDNYRNTMLKLLS